MCDLCVCMFIYIRMYSVLYIYVRICSMYTHNIMYVHMYMCTFNAKHEAMCCEAMYIMRMHATCICL